MRVLITGKNSYIGKAVKAWLEQTEPTFSVLSVCVRDEKWKQVDFQGYDAVFHVAGIAHSDLSGATDAQKAQYYDVNTELPFLIAQKAKASGVKHFIFMSSMIVYGAAAPIGQGKCITAQTKPEPANFYGDSKWQAELKLDALREADFKIAVIRPPMIYGQGAKGNYPKLARLAQKSPFFPDVKNARSLLHVDNLCALVRLILANRAGGVFHPQNDLVVSTADLVVAVAAAHGKKMRLVKGLNPLLKLLSRRALLVDKIFGSFSYDLTLSETELGDYRVRSFEESIKRTELPNPL